MAILNNNRPEIKTINFAVLLCWGGTFAVGAIAVSLMSYSVISDSVYRVWHMYLGIALFGAFGVVGLIGIIVLLYKYLILKDVLKHGTETVGKYDDVGRTISFSTNSNIGSGKKTIWWFNQIIFTYNVDGEERKYKSCAVYLNEQVEKLQELKTFTVKYKGKHAIICEKV